MYDKKKLIILRAALIVIGGVLGGTAMWQYFEYYPDVMRREFAVGVIVVSSAVLAAILGLSAKPFYRLFSSVASTFKGLVKDLGAKGVTAVVAGAVTAGMLGFLFDFLVRDVIEIIAVRVLADIILTFVLAALIGYGFVKWLAADDEDDSAARCESHKRGYLLTASCFFDDRVFTAAHVLINAKVTETAFRALWKYGGGEALERLRIVVESGAAQIIKGESQFADPTEYTRAETDTASARKLVAVAIAGTPFGMPDAAIALDDFSAPSDAVKDELIKKAAAMTTAEQKPEPSVNADNAVPASPADTDEPSGETIIHK